MLSKQLQAQIEQEAASDASSYGYEPGHEIDEDLQSVYRYAAGKYAALYEAALARAERAERALKRAEETTEKIIDLMDFVAEAKGHVSDEEIISQVRKSLPELLEALTPKTGRR